MNLDPLSLAFSQINYLVSGLSRKNYRNSASELRSLVQTFGLELERHLFRCLLAKVPLRSKDSPPPTPSPALQLLSEESEARVQESSFNSLLLWCSEHPLSDSREQPQNSLSFLSPRALVSILRLAPLQEVHLLSCFSSHSSVEELKAESTTLLAEKLQQAVNQLLNPEDRAVVESELEARPDLLPPFLQALNKSHLSKEQKSGAVAVIQNLLPQIACPVSLLPLLHPSPPQGGSNPLTMAVKGGGLLDGALPDLVLEMGYHFTNSVDECRASLLQLGGREVYASTVAKVIGVMVRTHTGLEDCSSLPGLTSDGGWGEKDKPAEKTWNVEVFIKSVHELQTTLNWKEIIYELDHAGFCVNDRAGLILLMKALKLGLQTQGLQGLFPMDLFYRHWKNTDGQLSLFQQILRNPDVFCFAEQQCHSSATEILKVQPDLENKDIATWRSLDLIETLLYLADNGHSMQVAELLTFPKNSCPDVLVLGLLQINPPITLLRQELLGKLFKVFLSSHANSGVILAHAWHSQSIQIKPILMLSMADWYLKAAQEGESEHSRLSRILDVAQDLKALSLMLNGQPFPFVIDLAILASRREYLNLEKWLTDKIREHGEVFVAATVKFLQRKIPSITGPGPLKEEAVPKASLPMECLATILICLQDSVKQMPLGPEVAETIMSMVTVCGVLLSRPRPPPPPGGRAGAGPAGRDGQGPPGGFSGPPNAQQPRIMQPPAGLFPPGTHNPESLANLSSQFSQSLQLSTPGLPPASSTAFALPGVLGPLVSGPGSPSRMFQTSTAPSGHGGGSPSPFPAMAQQPPHSSSQPPPGPPPPRPPLQPGVSTNPIEQVRSGNLAGIFPEVSGTVSREVEDEANAYFQRIYNHPPNQIGIDEVLELLKKFQTSGVPRETDVFNCMIKNLFEEYKFFPQYPDKELHITAQLFGGIIEHSLVTMVPLGLALRFVLEALRKPTDSNMFYFGVAALDRFKSRLKEYPQYCQHVQAIQHFKDFPAHLVLWVEAGTLSSEPPSKPTAPVLPPSLAAAPNPPGPPGGLQQQQQQQQQAAYQGASSQGAQAVKASAPSSTVSTTSAIVRPTASSAITQGRLSIANTTNIDTLLAARTSDGEGELVPPTEAEQDKVSFIFNNLSLMNLTPKTNDMREVLKIDSNEQHSRWLSQYLVMKRASIEPNFHSLYASFLEVLKSEDLYDRVVKETYKNIAILLRADKSVANFSDRSLLKNLGHWLGLMLLARNKPILMVDLDMKHLIIEAFHNGQQEKQQELLYVVPFVAKVLESAAKSKVFKPPCPWTTGLMNLLAELHQEPDLKLNLKFEIEVLCKTLNLEISELRPGNALKDYQRLGKLLSFKGFGVNTTPSNQLPALQKPMETLKKDFMQGENSFNNSSFGPSLTQAPSNFSPGLNSAAGAFSQPPGAAGVGMGSVMMATPQSAAAMTAQTAQAMDAPNTSKPEPSVTTPAAPVPANRPVEPKFHFLEINTANLSGLVPHITVEQRLPLLKEHPEFNQLIKLAIEKSVQEWISPVIERAIKIAITTCEQIVKKDFSLDFDETRMRVAAHHMVRNLTAGMAMITCRDHLLLSIKNNLKNIMMTLGRNLLPGQVDAIDVTVSVIANDNVELACAFIQKKAVEKAIPEIDKRLNVEIELRKMARKEGRRYCDPVALTYQAERMPDPIRLKVGQAPPAQAAVFDEFARNIPGFKPLTEREAQQMTINKPAVGGGVAGAGENVPGNAGGPSVSASEDCVAILDEVHSKLQPFIEQCTSLPPAPHMQALNQLLEALHIARTSKEVSSVIVLIGKAVESLLEGLTPGIQTEPEMLARFRDANILVLRAIADQRAYGPNWTGRQVTLALVDAREEAKWNIDAVDALIRSSLLNLFEYDKYLAAAMETERNPGVINFAMMLVKIYLIDDRSNANIIESDLFGTIEVLSKIANHSRSPPEGLVHLMDMIKMSSERIEHNLAMSGPTAQLHSGIAQAREFDDPHGLLEKTEFLLRDWVNMYHSPSAGKDSTKAFTIFVQQMNMHGLLKTDDLITRFFRMSTQMCVDLCYRALAEQNSNQTLVRAKCFHTLDAFVRLIALLVKHSGDQQNTITKVNLLNKVLGIVAGVLLIDHDVRGTEFQQVPYHRIFIMLFLELNAPDQILETINFQVLTAYCNMLSILRPAKVAPGFAYAWLEIVSHRVFIGRILSLTPQQKGWPMYAQLLTALFKFLSPFLRNAELAKPVHRLYRGTLRVLLVLLHDFPEFLCDYHYGFCDVIPPNCIQMRNLILSAFPRNMRLPDPFTPNLKVDMLPEISIAPRMVTNFAALIKPSFKKDLDNYLKNRTPVSFLSELRTNLQNGTAGLNAEDGGMRYNISMINALVMYVGTQAIQFIRAKGHSPSMSSIAHSSHMDIFQNLAVDMDTEGRYLFLNCITNQLRYPNSHTHYFSCCLLYLFAEANTEAIQEQITRVLLERLIVNRPHPWGLLITFIELIKNPTFKFWTHEFVHCAPEIQKLFESVARSCMVASQPRQETPGRIEAAATPAAPAE